MPLFRFGEMFIAWLSVVLDLAPLLLEVWNSFTIKYWWRMKGGKEERRKKVTGALFGKGQGVRTRVARRSATSRSLL